MKCYYQVLGVENSSEAEAIKKAYYRLSLKYHPDKNVGRESEVTPLYQQIMEAYKVLSDPHERAWYDKHRDRILQGGMGRSGGDYEEERLDVYQYFTSSCYQGFTDEENGFYTVYSGVFKQIREEEMRAVIDPKAISPDDFPDFGTADSDFQTVVKLFYSNWEVFNSKKSYAWVETYDSKNAPHRFARRAMEMENKKLRDAARRERNEEVRALVAFVKKRDPRVAAQRQLLQEQSEARRLQALKVAEQVRARNRAQMAEEMAQWQESQARRDAEEQLAMERELERLETHWDGETGGGEEAQDESAEQNADSGEENSGSEKEEELDTEGLYCPACNKSFKTKAAYENHLPSKKHKKQVSLLREKLLAEDPSMANNVDQLLNFDIAKNVDGSEDEEDGGKTKGKSKRGKKANQKQNGKPLEEEEAVVDEVEKASEPVSPSEETNNVKPPPAKKSSKKEAHSESIACKVCKESFNSRNKLFDHIKETGHAVARTDMTQNTPAAPKSKKAKNKRSK